MSRQTRRTTRQAASLNEDPGAPVRSSIPSAHQRHPIARRGTRRSPQSRRSASVDHVKSSGDIGYDEVDENGYVIDMDELGAESQDSAVNQDLLDTITEIGPVLVRDSNELAETHQEVGMGNPTNRLRIRLGHQYNSLKSRLGKLGEDEYLDTSSSPWDNSLEISQSANVLPQEVAFRTNTVTLLSSGFELLQGNDSYEEEFFDHLDSAFPAQFSSSAEPARALDLAFRIRCQQFGAKLQAADKPEKAAIVAARIFCDAEYQNVPSAIQRLSNGPYRPFLGLEPSDSQALERIYQESMQTLVSQVLKGRTLQSVLNSLEELCPKETLLRDLRTWALETYSQFALSQAPAESEVLSDAADLSAHDNIVVAPENDDESDTEDDSDSEDDMAPAIIYQEANGPEQGSYFDGTATIARPDSNTDVSTKEVEVSASAKQIQVQEAVKELSVNDILGSQPYEVSMQVDSSPAEDSAVQDDVAMTDVDDDDDDDPFEEEGNTQGSGGADEFDDGNDDDNSEDDDDDFEEDTAPIKQGRRQAAVQSAKPTRRNHVKPRSSRSPRPSPPPSSSTHPARSPRPSGTSPTVLLASQKDLRAVARRNVLVNKGKVMSRVRTFWSDRDADLLVKLIYQYNCQWSLIAEAGDFEVYRDHQACRDKARNMKFRYLQTDQILPPNFDNVRLSPKEVQFVRNAGRNPNRTEDDVDADGEPTNTVGLEDD